MSKAAEIFNSSLRELNENDLEEKEIRQNLIIARNNIENFMKEVSESKSHFKHN
jgi:hypothetical protein